MRVRMASIVTVAAGMVFVSTLLFFGLEWLGAPKRVAVVPQLATEHAPCEDGNYECWSLFYKRLIAEEGSHVALADLKYRFEDGSARDFCHESLHDIGQAAYHEAGSMSEAFLRGDYFCRAGFFHGVLEGVFVAEGSEAILTNLDRLCADVPGKKRYSYDYFSCVHGIGHGLMAHFNHDLFASLNACDNLSGEWERGSCYGGVFMENVMSDSPEQPSRFLKPDDLLFPCNAVEEQHKQPCFMMQTSYMLSVNGGDFAGAFAMCGTLEWPHRITCYESIGRDVSGWSFGDPVAARAYCTYGETFEERSHCMIGVASDFIQSVGPDEALVFCEEVEEGGREACIRTVEWQLSAL